ncbi:g6792 [Coccomyxa viridis]|uniref:G6792 protein n=1 Tax=Coccomyxa viridis TaxID=1274662 RepID=A0ABP1FW77_9CHLO
MGKADGDVTISVPPEGVDTTRAINKSFRWIIPFLFITTCLTYIDRSNVSYGALQFRGDLHLNDAEYGLGAGIFSLGYLIFQVPSNLIITKVGAPTWLGILIFCWGIVAASTAAMKTKATFFVMRFLLGAFEAGCFPGSWYHLAQFFNSAEIAFGYASVASSTALSNVIGAPLAAGLLYMDGLGGLRGWQWLFIIEGLVTSIYGILLKFLLTPSPAKSHFLTPAERTWLQNRQDTQHKLSAERNPHQGAWWAPFWGMNFLRLMWVSIAYAIMQFGITAIVYFNPLIVEAVFFGNSFASKAPKSHLSQHDQAWQTAKIALISTILWVPVGIGMILISYSTKVHNERNLHAGIPGLVAGICFLCVPSAIARSPIGGYVVLIIAATGVWAPHGPMWSWPKTFLHGQAAAVGVAVFNGVGAIGGFCGPYVVGALVNRGGYVTCMQVLGGLFLVEAAMMFVYRPRNIEQENEKSIHQEMARVSAANGASKDARDPASNAAPTPMHPNGTAANRAAADKAV